MISLLSTLSLEAEEGSLSQLLAWASSKAIHLGHKFLCLRPFLFPRCIGTREVLVDLQNVRASLILQQFIPSH